MSTGCESRSAAAAWPLCRHLYLFAARQARDRCLGSYLPREARRGYGMNNTQDIRTEVLLIVPQLLQLSLKAVIWQDRWGSERPAIAQAHTYPVRACCHKTGWDQHQSLPVVLNTAPQETRHIQISMKQITSRHKLHRPDG